MEKTQLAKILSDHQLWLDGEGGTRADLSRANLHGANLSRANLSEVDLSGANLSWANLSWDNLSEANFSGANLYEANLRGADLSRADLYGASLSWADLSGANLSRADLSRADLTGANLREANLSGASLPKFQVIPRGFLMYGFKKLKDGTVCTLEIPAEAERTSSLIGRKCRAEYAKVISGNGISGHDKGTTVYQEGQMVYPDKYDGDIRVECASGIHFFQTPEEAEEY